MPHSKESLIISRMYSFNKLNYLAEHVVIKRVKESFTTPIRHGRAGDFPEVVLLGGVAVPAGEEHLLLALLRRRLDQPGIAACLARDVLPAQHERRRLHHLAGDFLKRPRAQVRHAHDRVRLKQLCAQPLEAGQEHPSVLRDHRLLAVRMQHRPAPLHKHREQVALAVRVVLLHEPRQLLVHARRAHVRRVGDHRVVLPRQDDRLRSHVAHLVAGRALARKRARLRRAKRRLVHPQDRAVLPRVRERLGQCLRRAPLSRAPVRVRRLLRLVNRLHVRLRRRPGAPDEPRVVVARPHHQRKVRQLRRPLVDVQPVQVVLQYALHRLPVGIPRPPVHRHQHVERVHEDMPRTHARV